MSLFVVLLMLVAVMHNASAANETVVQHNCPQNQTWATCGRICEPTCITPVQVPLLCPWLLECTAETANCRCNDTYVRHVSTNKCVKLLDCNLL